MNDTELIALIKHAFDGCLNLAESLPPEKQKPYIIMIQADMRIILKKLMAQLNG